MHIVHIASELAPIAKTGGLGDVLYGLCKELVRQGHKVTILLPKYDTINYNLLQNLQVYQRDLWSYDGEHCYHNTIWSATLEELTVFLLEPHHPSYLFSRGTIYGCIDDIDRFFYFSRAAMEFLFKTDLKADLLHVHDWQTALIPVLQQDMYKPLGWKPLKTVLTLHNLEHQGKCSPKDLTRFGLRGNEYLTQDKLQDPQQLDLINTLKGGILYADAITTVSPSYKEEISEAGGGFGLHDVIKQSQKKICGILNGIDEDFWNPKTDKHLKYPFRNIHDLAFVKNDKELNKKSLRAELGLTETNVPIVAYIGRLVEQKGPFLIAEAFKYLLSKGAQCIILGSAYPGEILDFFLKLQSTYKSNPNGKIILAYNESLSHKIYAASDMLLAPSLFEPCGLTQMIALRYGSIPVVRKTGGLADTIFDVDAPSYKESDKNGFTFEKADAKELIQTLDRALKLFEKTPTSWQKLLENGFLKDFSWKKAAKEYSELYSFLNFQT